jgi:cytochrome c peroxidase
MLIRVILTIASIALATISCSDSGADDYDDIIYSAINNYGLKPLPKKQFIDTPFFRLGEALFFDATLSGDKKLSCASCHFSDQVGADARSRVSRSQILENDQDVSDGAEVLLRNVPDLANRDHNSVVAMRWDGSLHIDPHTKQLRTPLDGWNPIGFDNLMAVQSVLPLFEEHEMLGRGNELERLVRDKSMAERPDLIMAFLFRKIIKDEEYGGFLKGIRQEKLKSGASIIGNALAHYIEMFFNTSGGRFDRYIEGDREQLTKEEKEGAIIFLGKGRCIICHNGSLFSDFRYHSIGINDEEGQEDLGRYLVTKREEDKYKFKTPSLRNVAETAPYFHNGMTSNLVDAIKLHINPIRRADTYKKDGSFRYSTHEIDALSPILSYRFPLNDKEIKSLMSFLQTLSGPLAGQSY